MAEWKPEPILVETTVRGKRVTVDPVEWINSEFEFNRHLDRFLHSILENFRQGRHSDLASQV